MKNTLSILGICLFCAMHCPGQELVRDYGPHVMGTPYHRLSADHSGNIFLHQHFDHLNGEYVGSLAKLDANGKLATDFNDLITDGVVVNFGVQQDGKILISGDFTIINGAKVPNLVRLNPDGTIDASFHSALAQARDFQFQSDGKIIVRTESRLERLNTDGSIDPTFSMIGYFYSSGPFKVGPDDHIYISTYSNVYRLMPNGGDDPDFFVGEGVNESHISALEVQSDGKVIIGGFFTSFNNHPTQSLARLLPDGQVDTGFDLGAGPAGQIFQIVERQNKNILIGGQFSQYNGQPASLVEIRPDGSLKHIIAVVSTNWITTIIETPDQKITIGGEFTNVNGMERSYVAQFNTDYTINNVFDPLISYSNPNGRFLHARKNGAVITGGSHDFWGILDAPTATDKKIVQLTPLGEYDEAYAPQFPYDRPHILSSLLQKDEKLILGGFVQEYNGPTLARYNADGTKDNAFNIGTGPGNTTVQYGAFAYAMAERNDTLYLGGNFEKFNGVPSQSLVAIHPDGSIAKTFSVFPPQTHMHGIAFQSDGRIIVLGDFPFPSGLRRIVRLNADGSLDEGFGIASMSGNLAAIKVDDHDRIYVAGSIYTINGALVNSLVRLLPSGNLDTSFGTGTGFAGNDDVRIVELLPNGLIAAGGYFMGYNGVEANGFVMLDQTGAIVPTPLVRFGKKSAVTTADYSNGILFLGGKLVHEQYHDVYGTVKIQIETPTIPTPPGQLTVDLQSPGVFVIGWTDNSMNEHKFVLERSAGNEDNFVPIDTLAFDVASAVDGKIASGVTYFYRVKAVNNAGGSAYSNVDALKWTAPPTAPDKLSVEMHTPGEFVISWADNSSDEESFILERSETNSQRFVAIDTLATNVTSAQDQHLVSGTTYFYRIKAVNDGGASGYSNIGFLRWTVPPLAPNGLTVEVQSPGAFLVSWMDNSDNEDSFILERSENNQNFFSIDTLAADVTQVYDHDIVSATTYFYHVKAVNKGGASDYSNTVAAQWIEPPVAELDLMVTQHSETALLLTWQGTASGHDGFILERSDTQAPSYKIIDTVSVRTYSYVDKVEPDTKYFYKVSAYNRAGRVFSNEMSSIISGVDEQNSYTVYPVPANDVLFIAEAPEEHRRQWYLLGPTGQVMILDENRNDNVTELDIRAASPGIYVLRYEAHGRTVISKRVVILR